ncbi:MAG TPA: tetratricopeptide repeat protein, partial [Gallionella sp.]|nr:tetratricopeptide repeat protein [Gallionella sp.]
MRKKLPPLALALILNGACLPAHAETGAAEAPVVTAKAFRITGSRAFTEAELLKLVEHSVGQKLSRSELIELADSITAFYRQHGFPRAHAIVPAQSFSDGVVRFLITTAPASTAPESLLTPSPVVRATGFHIAGSRAFTEAQLLTLVADAVGKELTPGDLDALAQRITGYYRQHGYMRARAVVRPGIFEGSASRIVEGIVRFLITTLPAGEPPRPERIDAPAQPPDFDHPSDNPVQTLLERAQWWEARDRIDLAQESLDKLFSIVPGQPSGLALQAQIAIRRNQPEEAKAALEKLRRVQPDHPAIPRIEALLRAMGPDRAELRRARSLAKAGRYEEAVALFRKLFPDGPPSDDLTLEYWQLVANTPKGWYPARDGIAKLLKNNPDNPRYRLALAEHETSRLPIKRQALQVIIDMTKVPAYSQQARDAWRSAMRRLSDSPSSLPLLRDYLAAEPNDSAIREKRALIVKAEERHRRLMADPNYRAGVEGLALLDKGELEKAEPLLEQALRARATDSELVGNMGLLRMRQGRNAEAQEFFAQAAHLSGNSKKWISLVDVAKFWQLMAEARNARRAKNFALAENRLYAALQVKPDDPNALSALAAVKADRGLFDVAVDTYRHALSVAPLNADALEGLIALYRSRGMEQEAQQTIAQLSPAQRNALGATLNRIEAAILKEQADRLLASGQEERAIPLLEQAVHADADDPWSRFTLARLYAKRQHPEQGQALFDDLLDRHPGDAEALYAMALYQSGEEQSGQVLATLERIPADQRSAKTSRLWGSNLERLASAQVRAGRRDEAIRLLRDAEARAANDEEAGLAVALAWARIGEYTQADRAFETLHRTPPSIRWRLRHAEYLALKDAPELGTELDAIAAMPLAPDEKQELYALQESFAIRTANAYLAANQPGLAHQTLAPFLKNNPDRIPLLLAEAQAYWAEEQWTAAQTTFAHVLRLESDEPDARRGLIETQLAAGDRAAALAQLDAWTKNSTRLSNRLQLVDLYLTVDEPERAREQLDTLLAQYPNHPGVLNQAWQLAQHEGRLDDEIVYLQKALAAEYAERTPARAAAHPQEVPVAYEHIGFDELGVPQKIQRDWKEKKLAALIDRRTDWLSSAVDVSSRSGTSGTSRYHAIEIPVEYRTPWHANDEVFFRTDIVRL